MKQLENLDLNLLLLLHWLIEDRSVTRAASRVGLSQPAASRGLQRLRGVFSDELLIRSGRGYTLSRLAHSIRGDLSQAVQYLRLVAHQEDTFIPAESQDTIVIASNDYLSTITAQAWAKGINPAAPMMRSSWRPLDTSVMEALASGQVDLAFIPDAARKNIPATSMALDMVVRPLLDDHFVVFGPHDHPALTPVTLSLETFASADHVLVSPDGRGVGFVDRTLESHGLQRTIAHRTASFNHAADLALMTGCLTVLPQRLAALKPQGISRALPFESPALNSRLVWHASRTNDKAHTWVRSKFQAYFRV